jgi:hypothetical protein
LALGLPDLVGNAVGVFPNTLVVLLHLLEATQLVLDSSLDVSKGFQVALIAHTLAARGETKAEKNRRVQVRVGPRVRLVPYDEDVATEIGFVASIGRSGVTSIPIRKCGDKIDAAVCAQR